MINIISRLEAIQQEYIDAFTLEFNPLSLKRDPDKKQMAKDIKANPEATQVMKEIKKSILKIKISLWFLGDYRRSYSDWLV